MTGTRKRSDNVVVMTGIRAPPPTDATRLGHIEISIDDAIVRVLGQVEAVLLTTVLRAVRRAS